MEDLRKHIRFLEGECARLKAENLRLRGLSCGERLEVDNSATTGKDSPKMDKLASPSEKIELFRTLFKCRDDVYPVRWQNHQGKTGYSPACKGYYGMQSKEDRKYYPITNDVVRSHLSGEITMGVYPIMPDDTCWFLAADFDKKTWKQDCNSFLNSGSGSV